jgi:hypothetical protein
MKTLKELEQEEIEKAWALLSMHNSELLLRVAELEAQLQSQIRNTSIWQVLVERFRHFLKGKS